MTLTLLMHCLCNAFALGPVRIISRIVRVVYQAQQIRIRIETTEAAAFIDQRCPPILLTHQQCAVTVQQCFSHQLPKVVAAVLAQDKIVHGVWLQLRKKKVYFFILWSENKLRISGLRTIIWWSRNTIKEGRGFLKIRFYYIQSIEKRA